MRFAGSVFFFVLLISLQTTIFSSLPCTLSLYDILIPAVVYLTLFRPYKTGFPAIIIAGVVMDILSEAPPGFYFITYTIIFLVFQKSKKYFHVLNMALFQIVTVIGILIEYFIFSLLTSIQAMRLDMALHSLQTVLIQVAWAVVTVPLFYFILGYGFKHLDQFVLRGLKPGV